MSEDALVICEVCGFSVPTSDPEAVREIADHLRRKHPRAVDLPVDLAYRETARAWIDRGRVAIRNLVAHRYTENALGVAARLRTALNLIEAILKEMEYADGVSGPDHGLVPTAHLRERIIQHLEGG